MTQKRITLSGYYGFGNAGDEAVLAGLVQGLRAAPYADELAITALSMNPRETRTTHGILAAHRAKIPALIRAVSRTDLLLSGGGSLLQDVTSAYGIFYYLGVVRLAQILGKKTMFIAQGIGPLNRPRSRRLTASVANRLNAVTVRDPQSAALLREIGVTRSTIEVTADPALLLADAQNTQPKQNAFGVALRPWPGHEAVAYQVADACANALHGSLAMLFAMQPMSDKTSVEQFAQKWHLGNRATLCSTETGLATLLQNISCCEMMVGMRLHALILAAACGIPSVALSYDPKVAAFMEQSGQGDAVYDLKRQDTDALTALLLRQWAERKTRAEALEAHLPALRQAAERNIDVALSLLS